MSGFGRILSVSIPECQWLLLASVIRFSFHHLASVDIKIQK